jgi:hypothetical protein
METERQLKKLVKQMAEEGIESEDEVDRFLAEFNSAFASGYSNDSARFEQLDKAYDEYELGCDLLHGGDPEDEREAVRHLKKAIKLDPPFYDAQLQLLDLEQDPLKYIEKLKALEAQAEKGCLDDCGFERAEVFGDAWGHMEMRPFLRIKHRLAMEYLAQDMRRLALGKLEELLEWNEGDNQGCRYVLIGLYAFFEDEDSALRLFNHYGKEPTAWNLLSLAALYYKRNDDKACLSYIKQLAKAVPATYETIYRIIEDPDDAAADSGISHYRPGSEEELRLALADLDFLIVSSTSFLTHLAFYAIDQHEKKLKAQSKPKADTGKAASGKKPAAKKGAKK